MPLKVKMLAHEGGLHTPGLPTYRKDQVYTLADAKEIELARKWIAKGTAEEVQPDPAIVAAPAKPAAPEAPKQ